MYTYIYAVGEIRGIVIYLYAKLIPLQAIVIGTGKNILSSMVTCILRAPRSALSCIIPGGRHSRNRSRYESQGFYDKCENDEKHEGACDGETTKPCDYSILDSDCEILQRGEEEKSLSE